jgi:hypothetical protein
MSKVQGPKINSFVFSAEVSLYFFPLGFGLWSLASAWLEYYLFHVEYLNHAAQLPSLDTMQEPTGASGVHVLPKSGQSVGSMMPLSTWPQAHPAGSDPVSTVSRSNRLTASNWQKSSLNDNPEAGIIPSPRQWVSHGSNTS